jgi:hypothetical protein
VGVPHKVLTTGFITRKVSIDGNGTFTNYAPELSIKTDNYILPYSLQILTLLLLLDDNL